MVSINPRAVSTDAPQQPLPAPEPSPAINAAPRLHDALAALDEALEYLDGSIGTTRWAADCLYGAQGKDENIKPLTFPASDEGSITARILARVDRLKALDAHLRTEAQRLVDL
jgi:hypothetical protein